MFIIMKLNLKLRIKIRSYNNFIGVSQRFCLIIKNWEE